MEAVSAAAVSWAAAHLLTFPVGVTEAACKWLQSIAAFILSSNSHDCNHMDSNKSWQSVYKPLMGKQNLKKCYLGFLNWFWSFAKGGRLILNSTGFWTAGMAVRNSEAGSSWQNWIISNRNLSHQCLNFSPPWQKRDAFSWWNSCKMLGTVL